MNTIDVLRYGHKSVMMTVEGLKQNDWLSPGVTGIWSIKDLLAHLASHEQVLVEILSSFLDASPTPTLDKFKQGVEQFNDPEVEARRSLSPDKVMSEYEMAHLRTLELIALIPVARRTESGTLPWYGKEYDLEDFIVYGCYGHKREHSAQIDTYRSRIGR